MILETILFTALPTARRGNDLFASVLISPQLGGEEGNPRRLPLSRYQDFRDGNWPRIVRGINWQFTLRWSVDDRQEDDLDAVRISDDPDPDLFALMFPGTMPVEPFVFRNPADAAIVSYPAARLAGDLDRLQESVARQSPEERPRIDALVTRGNGNQADYAKLPLDGFVLDESRRAKFALEIDQVLATNGVLTNPGAGAEGTARSLAMLEQMLAPSLQAGQLRKTIWPDLDFHQVISLLSSHPNLLRRLGLLVDLRIPIGRIRRNTGNPRVYPVIDWPRGYNPDEIGLDITTAFPRVRATLGTDYFRPTPRSNALVDSGFVNLSSAVAVTSTLESESVNTSVDATGTARLMSQGRETYGTPDRRGIPARHSAGVEIVRPNEARTWRERMSVTAGLREALRVGDDMLLDAEDLLMGYRLDIRKVGGSTWRSLHRRKGTLTPYQGRNPQGLVGLGEDEGWSETSVTANPEDETDGVAAKIRLREALVQWDGWSLSLPSPADALDDQDLPSPETTAAEATQLIDSMHGTIDYVAPDGGARLPTLRFSKTEYEARLRWVDLGGNSVAPDVAGGSILRFPYQRHDPVASPDIYLQDAPEWSEAVDVMVLRTANDRSANVTNTRRWIAPPRSAAFFCLLHGVFDDAQGRPQVKAYESIAGRESEVLRTEERPGDVHVVPTDPGAVPYLPDPLAAGLLIRGGPARGSKYNGEVSLGYRGTWPQIEVASIEARAARPGRNGIAARGDSIVVDLEPGRVAHLRVSHSLTGDGLQIMDLWRRIRSNANAARARRGTYWQLTPDRILVVVHAVQVPVSSPQFPSRPSSRRWKARREPGDTSALLLGSVTVDMPSTESVDVIGTRTYAVDDGPGTDSPRVIVDADMGVIGTDNVEDPAPGGGVGTVELKVRSAFADTRRQQVTLTAEAKSRFAEYFRTSITTSASSRRITLNGGRPVVDGSVRISWRILSIDGSATDGIAEDGSFTVDAQAGTVALNTGSDAAIIPSNAILTISFIPGPVSKSSTDRSVPSAQRRARITVPSSARPLPVDAEWILPAFAWSDSSSGGRLSSTRKGGWLRLYLARPWFSSGIGEELAVVLQPGNASRNDARDTLVTQWALDPITRGADLPGGSRQFPKPNHFDSSLITRNVRLAEMDAPVDLVRYRIGSHDSAGRISGFDAARDMYYVDIQIDPDAAYRPFVRLALARYQPSSVSGLQLSPIALVDVVQLEPDRTAAVTISGGGANQTARITLTGTSYSANEVGQGPGVARAILERYDGPTGPKDDPTSSAAWTAVQSITLKPLSLGRTAASWSGSLTVPQQRPTNRYRIAIEQFEQIRTDGAAGSSGKVVGERLVHQDIIRI